MAEKKRRRKNAYGFKLLEVIVIVIITGLLCTVATGMIFYKHYGTPVGVSKNEHVNEFLEVYSSILDEYYEDVDEQELVDSAINAMFAYLGDDYTEHLDEEQTNELLEKLTGEYLGIGIEIYQDKIIYDVFEDSPAEKAGMQVNDKIIKLNDEDLTDKDNEYIADKIKDTKGKFNITLLRGDDEITVTVEKDNLYVPSVDSKVIEQNSKKIGYMQISTFSSTTSKQFSKTLKKLENEDHIESLIIDVRGNAGGYLVSAKDIASLFLKKGKIIYSLDEKGKKTDYKDKTTAKREYPIVVLIDEYSASASEILTAALKYSYNATLVGKKTYGKGKVQQTLSLEDGSMAKYTTAKWLMPNGKCIDKIGITPDYEIDLEVNEDQTEIIDTQYNKAVEILSQ